MYFVLPCRSLLISQVRALHTSAANEGKRNFRKFLIGPKRGTVAFKQERAKNSLKFKKKYPDIDIPDYGTRPIGQLRPDGRVFVEIPEMIPELVVPDLTDFKLLPYVSYRCPEVLQPEFTARDLFNSVYSEKIMQDFAAGALDENGQPLQPSAEEITSPEQARRRARATYTDIWRREEETGS